MEASLQSLLLALDSSTRERAARDRLLRRRNPDEHASRRRMHSERIGKADGVPMSKRRVLLYGSRKPANHVEMRVRALRKLLPNGDSVGPHELFRDAADYIACLQMQVKVMKTMVDVLSTSNS